MWRLALAGAALAAMVAVGGYVVILRHQNAALRVSVASLERELAVQATIAAQKTQAAAVARAETDRFRAVAAESDEIREWIQRTLTGDNDAPIPDNLRTALDRILRRGPR